MEQLKTGELCGALAVFLEGVDVVSGWRTWPSCNGQLLYHDL